MHTFLTFDYELFFGENSGSLDKCILEPTDLLLKIAGHHNAKLVFFVDAGYLNSLKEESKRHRKAAKDYTKLSRQLEHIVSKGHEIQLHIHPHWQDSFFDGDKWVFDTSRYKLSSFSISEVINICKNQKEALSQFTDNHNIFAYRAGGWCIQPFEKIRIGLNAIGIWLDSTVYPGGVNLSPNKSFSFKNAPKKEVWRFSNDPTSEDKDGEFVELAISKVRVSPLLYWGLAFCKLSKQKQHQPIGDGKSLSSGNKQTFQLLTQCSEQPVFLDGYKAKSLHAAFKEHLKSKKSYFVTIGHPKAMTPFSLKQIDFLLKQSKVQTKTFLQIQNTLQLI